MPTKNINDASFETEVLKAAKPTLVDFWAEWCGPCLKLAPTVDQLADDYEGRAVVGKLNVDENPTVAARFQIRGIPTLLVLKDGQVADTVVGLAGKEDIAEVLDRHL